MRVTRAQLIKVMTNAGSRADTYLPIINGWAEHFHINTPLRMAHYLAQIAHESGELRYTNELASGIDYDLTFIEYGKFKKRAKFAFCGVISRRAYNYPTFDFGLFLRKNSRKKHSLSR